MRRKYRSKVIEITYLFEDIDPSQSTVADLTQHHAVLSAALQNLSEEADRLYDLQREIHLAYKRK